MSSVTFGMNQSDVGYFLGCRFIVWLEDRLSLAAVARMSYDEIDAALHVFLDGFHGIIKSVEKLGGE